MVYFCSSASEYINDFLYREEAQIAYDLTSKEDFNHSTVEAALLGGARAIVEFAGAQPTRKTFFLPYIIADDNFKYSGNGNNDGHKNALSPAIRLDSGVYSNEGSCDLVFIQWLGYGHYRAGKAVFENYTIVDVYFRDSIYGSKIMGLSGLDLMMAQHSLNSTNYTLTPQMGYYQRDGFSCGAFAVVNALCMAFDERDVVDVVYEGVHTNTKTSTAIWARYHNVIMSQTRTPADPEYARDVTDPFRGFMKDAVRFAYNTKFEGEEFPPPGSRYSRR